MMTPGVSLRAIARTSPKSGSNVSTILLSATAFASDQRVGRTYETFVAEVNSVVISPSQRLHGRERHAHVGKESHAAGLLKKPISSFASAEAYCKA